MSNRNPMKQFFITFPHSNVDKVNFRDALLRFDPDYYKIAEEKHKDGTPHLHGVIRTKNTFTKKFLLNYFAEKYPDDYKRIDIKPVRSIKNSINYLSKEDKNPLESGEYIEKRNPVKASQTAFARECGYDNVDQMLEYYRERDKSLDEFAKLLFKEYQWHLQSPEFCMPYEVLCSFDRIISSEYHRWKDDITILEKFFKIKFKLAYV